MFLFSPLTLTAHVLIGFEEISPHLSGKPKAYVAAAKQVRSLTLHKVESILCRILRRHNITVHIDSVSSKPKGFLRG